MTIDKAHAKLKAAVAVDERTQGNWSLCDRQRAETVFIRRATAVLRQKGLIKDGS